jgi:hypothetical protein
MCVWDGAFDQPFWEREALQLAAEGYEPDEVDCAPGTEPPRPEGEGPYEPPMRRLEASRQAARRLWDEVQRWIQGARRMIRLSLTVPMLLSLLASRAEGQASSVALDTVAAIVAPYAKPHIVTQLNPNSSVRKVWDRVVSCAGAARDTTKTFEQIKFFQRDTVLMDGRVMKGEWVAPDTIFITTGFTHESWVVAHEMLHHALNGPPTGPREDPHVKAMVTFLGCGLLELQQPRAPLVGSSTYGAPSPYYRFDHTDPLTNKLREPGL